MFDVLLGAGAVVLLVVIEFMCICVYGVWVGHDLVVNVRENGVVVVRLSILLMR